jgi:hypothetical protein
MILRYRTIASIVAAVMLSAAPAAFAQEAPAGPVAQPLALAAQNIDAALAALNAGDVARARQYYGAYDDAWDALEDNVRGPHPDVYDTIERAMDDVDETLLKVDTPSPAVATTALQHLRQTIDAETPLLG